MGIEKEKLKLIRDYSFQIEIFNGVIQWAVGLFMAELFFIIYLSNRSTIALGFVVFALVFLVVLIVQTIHFAKRDAYVIEGLLEKKRAYSSYKYTSRMLFKLQMKNFYRIPSDLNLASVLNFKKTSYDCHDRVFEKLNEGYQGLFALTGSKEIFAVLDEIGTLSKEDLKISWRDKKLEIVIVVILLLVSTGCLIVTLMK